MGHFLCASEFCRFDAGMCSAHFGPGVACTFGYECESRECDLALGQCAAACPEVQPNDAGGCLAYDLESLSSYIFFSLVLLPLARRRKPAP